MKNNQFIYNQQYEGMNGIILDSRGGAKDSNNFRNPDYKLLRRYILERLQQEEESEIQIYIASHNSFYKNIEDRLISIDGVTEFNLKTLNIDDFETKLNEAVRLKGQVPNTKGGNDTKKIFFKTNLNLLKSYSYQKEEKEVIDIDLENILNKFSFDFKRPSKNSNLLKPLVEELQEKLFQFLSTRLPHYTWEKEYNPSNTRKDSIDIFGYNKTENKNIVFELDPHRADSISKKFVSRIAILKDENLQYVAFIYPGTDKMLKNESIKYCEDCKVIANMMSTDTATKQFISFFLN